MPHLSPISWLFLFVSVWVVFGLFLANLEFIAPNLD